MRMTTRVSPPVLGGVAAASADGVVIFVHYHLELIRFLASEHRAGMVRLEYLFDVVRVFEQLQGCTMAE